MTYIENSAVIVRQELDMPDIGQLEARYDVEFVEPSRAEREDFARMCDGLEAARYKLAGMFDGLGIAATKPAVAYIPPVFLKEPLTSEQAAAINNTETAAVADYALGVQAQLAKVPIEESGEPVVNLRHLFAYAEVPATFSDVPFHSACGEWAGKERQFWAREGFASRVAMMGKLLQTQEVALHFEDVFRPVGVQEGLFKRRVEWTRRDHPDWSDEQIIAEAQSKTAVMPRLASHKGGAAVDARLRSLGTDTLLDIGHNYPDGGALVFPKTPFVTANQWHNRQLFQIAAGLADTTLYVGEDWHISYGDNLASLDEHGRVRPGYVAQYGPIKDFDRETGVVTEVYSQSELDQVFDY